MANATLAELHDLRRRLSAPDLDQGHLFTNWPAAPDAYTAEQVNFLMELHSFGKQYHGGVVAYIRTAQRLLSASNSSVHYTNVEMPSLVYQAPSVFANTAELNSLEERGVTLAHRTVYVLVAGGLGERLGYSGIKLSLPVETATRVSYLSHYLSWALQVGGPNFPFVIMTSEDTHTRTVTLLEELDMHQMPGLLLLKQETVFCFADPQAHLAYKDRKLLRKPHGHGDVHSLVHRAVLPNGHRAVEEWLSRGYEYITFLQDTNAPAIFTLPVLLALSEREKLDLSITCIPRIPKEPIGLLCRVRRAGDPGGVYHHAIVEYNLVEEVAQLLTGEGGDMTAVNGHSTLSACPGSINTLLCKLSTYRHILDSTGGLVPEFINPKYTDHTHTAFRSPSRVESLMEDLALHFTEKDHRLAGIVFERLTFQPVKNSLAEGVKKLQEGLPSYSVPTGEADYYEWMRRRLRAVGVAVPEPAASPDVTVLSSIPVHLFPIVTMDSIAQGAGMLADLQRVFPQPSAVHISAGSTVMIEGRVVVESLDVDGAVRLVGPSCAGVPPLLVRDVTIRTRRWRVRPTDTTDTTETDLIRGCVLEKDGLETVGYT